jgi:hypothetical protein
VSYAGHVYVYIYICRIDVCIHLYVYVGLCVPYVCVCFKYFIESFFYMGYVVVVWMRGVWGSFDLFEGGIYRQLHWVYARRGGLRRTAYALAKPGCCFYCRSVVVVVSKKGQSIRESRTFVVVVVGLLLLLLLLKAINQSRRDQGLFLLLTFCCCCC